jgi:tetratricopeptide (TPR) repeat protein
MLAALAGLAACGLLPRPWPEAPAQPVAGVPAPSSEPAAQPSESAGKPKAEGRKADKSAKTEAAAPAATAPPQPSIPAEAVQQFESALALMGSGNTAGAEQAFRALTTAYPTYSGALLNLGILQAKAGKLEDAEKTLQDAIVRNAANATAFNQLGIVYRKLGRFKDADDAYQRAVQIDPNYAIAYLNLGVLCDLYLQQPQRALEAYERYLQLAAAPDAKVNGWVTELKARLGAEPRTARTQ